MSLANDNQLYSVCDILAHINAEVMGKRVAFRCERDKKRPVDGRIFIQCRYRTRCAITRKLRTWHGRKWYLSEHMLIDEIVKTAYAAFKACVEHEVMEGFTWGGDQVFNPHTPFHALLTAAKTQEFRP